MSPLSVETLKNKKARLYVLCTYNLYVQQILKSFENIKLNQDELVPEWQAEKKYEKWNSSWNEV